MDIWFGIDDSLGEEMIDEVFGGPGGELLAAQWARQGNMRRVERVPVMRTLPDGTWRARRDWAGRLGLDTPGNAGQHPG